MHYKVVQYNILKHQLLCMEKNCYEQIIFHNNNTNMIHEVYLKYNKLNEETLQLEVQINDIKYLFIKTEMKTLFIKEDVERYSV